MDEWAKIVAGVQAAWADAFFFFYVSAMTEIYTDDATLYGSRAELFRGCSGIERYCVTLSPGFTRARFDTPVLVELAPGAVAASGPVTFDMEKDGATQALRFRLTQVVVEHAGRFLIATHHASPEPPE